MIVLIPAYEPDQKLVQLVKDIKILCNYKIIVVDDGSGAKFHHIFEQVKNEGCIVLKHILNYGKGKALKTGFKYILEKENTPGVICADSDGQHLPKDIIKIAQVIKDQPNNIILGARHFQGKVPFKSRFGNSITRAVFSFSTGKKIFDTQTGLRGFSSNLLNWLLTIKGERFEYEMNMLLDAGNHGVGLHEVEINTIYHQRHSTHFRAIKDSAMVYMPIVKFSASSISSALIDYLLLFLLQTLTGNLFLAATIARICSSVMNYSLNKIFVFPKGKDVSIKSSLIKYFSLVFLVFAFNYSFLYFYYHIIGMSLIIAKILTESTLFIFSYWSQKKFIFKKKKTPINKRLPKNTRVNPTSTKVVNSPKSILKA